MAHTAFFGCKTGFATSETNNISCSNTCCELYLDSGIRAMERGIVSAGRNSKTGNHYYPDLELVRLTIPRRVYTQAHMGVIVDSVETVFENRKKIKGLKMIYEPKYLRFFQARFEKVE